MNTQGNEMNIIIWLAIGGLVGWVASKLMGSSQGVFMDVIIGIAGSFIGAWLLGPMVGGSIDSGDFSAASLGVSLLGAVVLLAVASLWRRASAP
jgi:uncharacterized membrane protein YeaQ/YmgE (transglycosylase-associated protein family)